MVLEGAAVVITGGSRGLGRALGRTLAAAGARVVLVARGEDELRDAVEEIRAAGGVAHAIAADVGDKHAIHRIAGGAAALVGPIDVLVNAASTLGPTPLRALMDTECEDLERVLQVNVIGPFRLTKALAGPMSVRGRGVVPRERGRQRGGIVDDEQIAVIQDRWKIGDRTIRHAHVHRIDHEHAHRVAAQRRGDRSAHERTSQRDAQEDAEVRDPLGAASGSRIIATIFFATSCGSASVAGSASGIASRCICVSISPGSTLKQRTPRSASSAAQMRLR